MLGILNALHTGIDDGSFSSGAKCHCPVDCEEDTYMPEMSQADIRPGEKRVMQARHMPH